MFNNQKIGVYDRNDYAIKVGDIVECAIEDILGNIIQIIGIVEYHNCVFILDMPHIGKVIPLSKILETSDKNDILYVGRDDEHQGVDNPLFKEFSDKIEYKKLIQKIENSYLGKLSEREIAIINKTRDILNKTYYKIDD